LRTAPFGVCLSKGAGLESTLSPISRSNGTFSSIPSDTFLNPAYRHCFKMNTYAKQRGYPSLRHQLGFLSAGQSVAPHARTVGLVRWLADGGFSEHWSLVTDFESQNLWSLFSGRWFLLALTNFPLPKVPALRPAFPPWPAAGRAETPKTLHSSSRIPRR